MNVRLLFFTPLSDGPGTDQLIGLQQIGRYGQACLRTAGGTEIFVQFQVAVRCFDENLRLVFALRPGLEMADSFVAVGLPDRQVAVESERLAVETRGHQGQQDR